MVPPILLTLFHGSVVRAIDVVIFTLEIELALSGVEALFVVFWVAMESDGSIELRGDIGRIVISLEVVWVIVSAIDASRIVNWIGVRMDLMESESNLSLVSTLKSVGDITIFSIVEIFNMEYVLLSEMIKLSWWSWHLASDLLFSPLNAILGISMLGWIKLEIDGFS